MKFPPLLFLLEFLDVQVQSKIQKFHMKDSFSKFIYIFENSEGSFFSSNLGEIAAIISGRKE